MQADQNDIENLSMLLASAGVNYILGVPTSDDVMLNYQTNAYHDVSTIREILGLRPIKEFDQWLEKMGISENGKLTKDVYKRQTLWMSIPDILSGGSEQLPDNQERAG